MVYKHLHYSLFWQQNDQVKSNTFEI
jgi:hypothetical protein